MDILPNNPEVPATPEPPEFVPIPDKPEAPHIPELVSETDPAPITFPKEIPPGKFSNF